MKVQFVVDGKIFEDKKEALEYEQKVKAEKEEKRKKQEEQETRKQEVEDAYHKYNELLDKYIDDYCDYNLLAKDSSLTSLLKMFGI